MIAASRDTRPRTVKVRLSASTDSASGTGPVSLPSTTRVAGVAASPLYPADKLERARVDQWMTFFTCHPGRWLTKLFFEKVVKPVAGMGEPDAAACEEAVRFAGEQLKMVDDWLDGREWLANDAFSIAEPFALAYVEQARAVDFPLEGYPQLRTWLERLDGRNSTIRARALVKPHMDAMLSR